jgi:teichuronic acid biosynthesis glycosyltransferase TuaC
LNVLFVASGNNPSGVSPIILNQAKSLADQGLNVDLFQIKGKGIKGYASNIKPLREKVSAGSFDLVHAHYALCGMTVVLASQKPVVTSLMGSDLFEFFVLRLAAGFFAGHFWQATIVKSKQMKSILKVKGCHVIPNGVNMNRFSPGDRDLSRSVLKLRKDRKYILFVGNPSRKEKNHALAVEAVRSVKTQDTELLTVYNADNRLMPHYYNACEMLLMTSLWEGSPNAVKEAMASNCPIVSVDTGDISEIVSGSHNCFISEPEPGRLAHFMDRILENRQRSNGRNFIAHLEESVIAKQIIDLYHKILVK